MSVNNFQSLFIAMATQLIPGRIGISKTAIGG